MTPSNDPGDDNWLDLKSIDHVLNTTRSVRRKLDFARPVDASLLMECIDIATQAPTGIAGESWRFLLVTDVDHKAEIARLYKDALETFQRERGLELKPTQLALVDRLHEMPVMIFVCYPQPSADSSLAEQIGFFGSVLPAAWSLMLALRARGLGSTWTSLLAARQTELRALLGVPEDIMLTVMLPVAHTKGAVLRKADRLQASDVSFWNGWEQGPESDL